MSEETVTVELTREEARALHREAGGQSVMYHAQLAEGPEEFWAIISNKLEAALQSKENT